MKDGQSYKIHETALHYTMSYNDMFRIILFAPKDDALMFIEGTKDLPFATINLIKTALHNRDKMNDMPYYQLHSEKREAGLFVWWSRGSTFHPDPSKKREYEREKALIDLRTTKQNKETA